MALPLPKPRAEKSLRVKAPDIDKLRKLPEDPDAFDAAIGPCKVMVRPILHGISRLAKSVGTDPLDKEEIDSGTVAFSALMYQMGGMFDARILVALWVAGVSLPRAIQFIDARKEAQEKKKARLEGRGGPESLPPTPKEVAA